MYPLIEKVHIGFAQQPGKLLFERMFVPLLWLTMPATLWYFVAAAALTRLAAYCAAAIRYHRFAALHTWLNKLTGGAVFLLPYVLTTSCGILYCWAVCALALLSSVEELTIHLCSGEYDPNRKSTFC